MLKEDKPNVECGSFPSQPVSILRIYFFPNREVFESIFELSTAPEPDPNFRRSGTSSAASGLVCFPHVSKPLLCCYCCSQRFHHTGLRKRKVRIDNHSEVYNGCCGSRTWGQKKSH